MKRAMVALAVALLAAAVVSAQQPQITVQRLVQEVGTLQIQLSVAREYITQLEARIAQLEAKEK